MSLISCLIITSLSLASRVKKRVKQRVYQRIQEREFTEILGWESVTHMSLITCHSSHVTHLMSRSQVSLISCLDLMSIITCHSSHISSLFHSSHVSSLCVSCLFFTSLKLCYCLYTLGWPDLTSAHDLCPLVTAQYYQWLLPNPSAVTYAHPAASFCPEG